MMTGSIVDALRAAGCVFAEEEAAILVAEAVDADELQTLVARRVSGEPLEHVVGWAEFCGVRIAVGPWVFVPRRRSELLADVAARLAVVPGVVVDLCCGSGAIGCIVAQRRPGIELHAADIDAVAVSCARQNLAGVGMVHEGDLFEALPSHLIGRVDVLVVNAPYVPSAEVRFMPTEARLHEPLAALDGGATGIELQRRVAAGAAPWLSAGGRLVVETSGALVHQTVDAFTTAGFSAQVVDDDDVGATVVLGERRVTDR